MIPPRVADRAETGGRGEEPDARPSVDGGSRHERAARFDHDRLARVWLERASSRAIAARARTTVRAGAKLPIERPPSMGTPSRTGGRGGDHRRARPLDRCASRAQPRPRRRGGGGSLRRRTTRGALENRQQLRLEIGPTRAAAPLPDDQSRRPPPASSASASACLVERSHKDRADLGWRTRDAVGRANPHAERLAQERVVDLVGQAGGAATRTCTHVLTVSSAAPASSLRDGAYLHVPGVFEQFALPQWRGHGFVSRSCCARARWRTRSRRSRASMPRSTTR